MNKESKLASSFELLYAHKPPIMGGIEDSTPVVSLDQHVEQRSRSRLHKMTRLGTRHQSCISIGDYVFFWREKSKWLGPSKVIRIDDNVVTVLNNGLPRSTSLNRVMPTQKPNAALIECMMNDNVPDEDETPVLQQVGPVEPTSDSSTSRASNDIRLPWVAFRDRDSNERPTDGDNMYTPSEPVRKVRFDLMSSTNYFSYLAQSIMDPDPSDTEKLAAYQREIDAWNEMSAMQEVPFTSLPPNANLIGSHVIFRRKPDGSLKARIVPWGHRDSDKSYLRKDAPCMNLEIFRLVISLAAEYKWSISETDVKSAFLQANGFDRDIFV